MDKIIEKLKIYTRKFPYEEIQEAINNKETITPMLLDILDEIIEDPSIVLDDPNYMMHEYGIFLLAQFREKSAFEKIIKLISMNEDDVEEMYGDTITEDISSILYSTYDGQLELIQAIIEDPEKYFYVRVVLLDLYIKLYEDNLITKDNVITYFKKLIYELPFNEDNDLANDIASAVSDGHIFELIPDVEYLYSMSRVDEFDIGEYDSFIDMIYGYDYNYGNVHYIDDTIKEMEDWACFEQSHKKKRKEKIGLKELDESELLRKYQSQGIIKIGRNDPCYCGSGKKFKKCCLNKTEEEKLHDREIMWLEDYPVEPDVKIAGRVYLSDNFDKEAIEIDKLVYLALHNFEISLNERREPEELDPIMINYLTKASRLFIIKCNKENINSFEEYDSRFKIHYDSLVWFEKLRYLIRVQKNREQYDEILNEVEEVLSKFM